MSKIVREFETTRGTLKVSYDPDEKIEDSVYIEHSAPLFLSIDDLHRLHSFFADFLSTARSNPQQVRQELPKDFATKVLPSGDFEVLPDGSTRPMP